MVKACRLSGVFHRFCPCSFSCFLDGRGLGLSPGGFLSYQQGHCGVCIESPCLYFARVVFACFPDGRGLVVYPSGHYGGWTGQWSGERDGDSATGVSGQGPENSRLRFRQNMCVKTAFSINNSRPTFSFNKTSLVFPSVPSTQMHCAVAISQIPLSVARCRDF